MHTYTVRIELHSSEYHTDFDTLHRAMKQGGFSKLITADDGTVYHLPRGVYNIETSKTSAEVLEYAKQAVATTHQSAEILVTEALSWSWDGLAEKK